MIRKYMELTRAQMEQVDREETIVLIPVGALEQHGNQAPLGTDDIIAGAMVEYLGRALEEAGEGDFPILAFPGDPGGTQHGTQEFLRLRDPEAGHLLPSAV